MQIEIAEHGRMTLTGSSLFDSIQNKHTPILDLLVRESIQNSLDAAVENTDYVNVGFLLGQFAPSKVNDLLEGVSEKLNERFSGKSYDYIAICDSNTVGLTGPLHMDDIEDCQNYGNLIKLIYEISKPQTQEGAGGSWGLGKTVYFRVGIGLVFYYSRIKKESGEYESRLAAALVEDERQANSVIPLVKGSKIKRGIAWWGQSRGTNSTCPLTNEKEINKILSYFGIPPYQNETTGTIVIIPYINKQELLDNNRPNELDEDNSTLYHPTPWYDSIENYLKIAVQRWYAPRLNNSLYKNKFLNVAINGKRIKKDDFEPIFSIIQDLYNIGTSSEVPPNGDIKFENISINSVLSKGSVAGRLIFKTASPQELKMLNPDNKPNPEAFCNLDANNSEVHKPLFAFTRKPGMIVSYKNAGSWLEGVSQTDENHFLIALFVLNSDNVLKNIENMSLEEYVRKSEHADHTSWNDHLNQKIISKIKNGVSKNLSKLTEEKQEFKEASKDSTFSRILGDLILPKIGFGKKPNATNKTGNNKGRKTSNGNLFFSVDFSKTKYTDSSMEITAEWSTSTLLNSTTLSLAVESEGGAIRASEWENEMGLSMPFEIQEVSLLPLQSKKDDFRLDVSKKHAEDSIENYSLKLNQTSKGHSDEIVMNFEKPTSFKFSVKIKINFLDTNRNKKPIFLLGKE